MATITEIYKRYKIMPQLQQHQLRVAAVAAQICDSFSGDIDKSSIIKACLLHDMANIIKFDLTKYPEFSQPEGLEYWEGVKRDFIAKYGSKEHAASMKIAEELGMSPEIIMLIGRIEFAMAKGNAAQGRFDIKISDYSDNRVSINGITSMEGRLADLRQRYAHWVEERGGDDGPNKAFEAAVRLMERQIFAKTGIKPGDITDASSKPVIEQLRTYEI